MENFPNKETLKFKNPEEEITFLRQQIAEKEKSLENVSQEVKKEEVVKEVIDEYSDEKVSPNKYQLQEKEVDSIVLDLIPEEHDVKMEELLGVLMERGIKSALEIVAKLNNPHLADDFHRFLIQYVISQDIIDLNKNKSIFKSLHMKLYEITLPEEAIGDGKGFKEVVSVMEQFYAGMLSISNGKDNLPDRNYFTLEIAFSTDSDQIIFYAAIPRDKGDLFEKQILAVYPDARVIENKDDYNIFNDQGHSAGVYGQASTNSIFPIKTYDEFDQDPLEVILNVFSKLKEKGEGAAIQFVISPAGDRFIKRYGYALDKIKRGVPVKEAINFQESFVGSFGKIAKEMVLGTGLKKEEGSTGDMADQEVISQISKKINRTILNTNIRIIASSDNEPRTNEILNDLQSAFNQFTEAQGNGINFKEIKGKELLKFFHEFSYRLFSIDRSLPLNVEELTTVMHFPSHISQSYQLKQEKSNTAPAPMSLPDQGVILGVNKYRHMESKIRFNDEDRMRHLYVIGQTGTGKTTLLKNMIVQDIEAGNGVCMIDPHGSDIQDILANIPKDRIDDVIYFDPAHTERPMGLNMLEYDERYPEQKTFVVNELFSIFQKLYGASPESMGPMFEQYFRNATMLVIEDPSSGNTLLDVSRVLSDVAFREMKLSRCKNPVVVQFWREVAGKAGGDAALANIVPYITSKFDIFLANEIMRPIVSQEKSAFNFREIMDEKKILLVNLSKGRLGDINANLIGLIIVGKILMAALSRVNQMGGKLNNFYLYIDEFQNITTPSIATILSEARKYRLSLNIAHQFIAQLSDDIKNAVFGNVGSMAIFRVGSDDAKYLESQFEPVFSDKDIMNIDNYNAYLKLLINGQTSKPFNIETLEPPQGRPEIINKIKELSYLKYGKLRAEVEEKIAKKYNL